MKTLSLLLLTLTFAFPSFAEEATNEEARALFALGSLEYDSKYVLYGYRLDGPFFHANLFASYPLADKTTLWGGSWFGIIPDGTYRELDGYIGINQSLVGNLVAGMGVAAFGYFDAPFTDKSVVYELNSHLSYFGERGLLALREFADTESHGSLWRLVGGYTQPLTARVALKGTAEFGYAFRYYISGNRANDVLLKLELPIALSTAGTLSPFIARTIALDGIKAYEKDDTFGGLSLSWTL